MAASGTETNNIKTIFSYGSLSSVTSRSAKIKKNREYLISESVATDLNTYIGFDPFYTFEDDVSDHINDIDTETGKDRSDFSKTIKTPKGVRSIFNKSSAVLIGGTHVPNDVETDPASGWRIGLNVPLMDSEETRAKLRENSACTVKDLVIASRDGLLGQETYDWSDFMYCKYLGRLPNTYMITLRRFPFPVDDHISSSWYGSERSNYTANNPLSIGCMVTWLGTPGNDISNILKYSYNMPFTEEKAKWEESNLNADSSKGVLNQIAAMFDKTYMKDFANGYGGVNGATAINKIFGKNVVSEGPYSLGEIKNFRDNKKVYGPVDAIKDTYRRSDEGLTFQHSFSLQFDYEMRSYSGINQRQAFLDLIANILTVTYSTGEFWGGAYWNKNGMHQNNIFTNLPIFQNLGNPTFTEYAEKFSTSLSTITTSLKSAFTDENGNFTPRGIINGLKSYMNSLGGMLIGGVLNKLGRPQKVMLNSLLSPAPVGFWHVTIGNPKAPIMSIGNMIISNATIEHYGPFGIDDFPTGLRVKVDLKRGRGRDSREIEMLYMGGNARIYSPMGPATLDMYENAKTYKDSTSTSFTDGNSDTTLTEEKQSLSLSTPKTLNTVLKRYFGTDNTSSILIAAKEQEYGAASKVSVEAAQASSS